MAKPRPTPPTPPSIDDQSEYNRPSNFELGSGGPRDFARLTIGSKQISGRSEVLKPEPQ